VSGDDTRIEPDLVLFGLARMALMSNKGGR
jgi:hypothetical protein